MFHILLKQYNLPTRLFHISLTQMQQQASDADYMTASPSFRQHPVASRLVASTPPLPGFRSPNSANGHATPIPQRSFNHRQEFSGELFPHDRHLFSASVVDPACVAQPQTFQEGQHVLYQKDQLSRPIPAIVAKVHDGDATGGPPYYDIEYESPHDIPEHVQGDQERACWIKQTIGDHLSPVEEH